MTAEERGSGISTGPMVPVLASNDESRSRAVLALLEMHGIPALLDADLEGAFVGFHDPVPDGWSQVLVPTSMRASALEVLRRHEADSSRRGRPPSVFELPRPSGRTPRPPVPSHTQRSDEEALLSLQRGFGRSESDIPGLANEFDLSDERPELVLPEPSPLEGRLKLALLAVAFGGAMQWILSLSFGAGLVVQHLAARHPLYAELHRLVTASFLHNGSAHFLSNAAFGLMFGVVLFGTHRVGATALTWLLASAVGMSAEIALNPEAIVVGASAGNYGLVGLWARGQFERARVALLPRRERLKTLGVLLLLVPGALTPFSSSGTRIAVLAHIGGFLAGYLAGAIFRRRLLPEGFKSIEARSGRAGRIAVAVASAGWVVGLLRLAWA